MKMMTTIFSIGGPRECNCSVCWLLPHESARRQYNKKEHPSCQARQDEKQANREISFSGQDEMEKRERGGAGKNAT